MSNNHTLLRQIPKVDELLCRERFQRLLQCFPRPALMECIRAVLQTLRTEILQGVRAEIPDTVCLSEMTEEELRRRARPSLRRVINATGVVLHTNLGRAKLCRQAARAVEEVADGYSTLEYNVDAGCRGSRYDHVEPLLCKLTGAESAMVVNNNAAAVLLTLSAMVRGKEAVVSRGELVEIGGSFRVPDIMEQSGGVLREVGTTNKTHLRDYASAIEEGRTGALLKVHTSNYKILGFTQSVPLPELVKLGEEHGVPVIYDVGSGAMLSFASFGLPEEPRIAQCVKEGADVVCFSGDKLLGGPQAGIIVGKKRYLDLMKRHPLTRAFRVDKMTLAALEATLRLYQDEELAKREIPTLNMLFLPEDELKERAERLCAAISQKAPALSPVVEAQSGQVGGGSMPGQFLPGYTVALSPETGTAMQLETRLRGCEIPLIGRIAHEKLLLDVRTIDPEEYPVVVENLVQCME